MPMIDVYAATGTFAATKELATELATTLMRIEGVPDIPIFRQNTAAFIHETSLASASIVDGENSHVRSGAHQRRSARPGEAAGFS